jgi:hypothetical protein
MAQAAEPELLRRAAHSPCAAGRATGTGKTPMSETPIRKDKVDARQGKSGLGVRYVLIGGLVLAIVALAIIALFVR